ncbi:Zinc finger protein 692, partial [Anas platyrhynchos]
RSKCRIRLGGHLEQWCRLKEQLGFALHSQLAKFLLDRYSSQGCVLSPEPSLLHADALQRLVALSHGHGQECGFVPDVKPPASGSPAQLVWECVAGHSFSWGVPTVADGQQPWGVTEEDLGSNSPPVPRRRRLLRRAGLVAEPKMDGSSPKKDGAEAEVAAWSPAGDGNQREEAGESSDGVANRAQRWPRAANRAPTMVNRAQWWPRAPNGGQPPKPSCPSRVSLLPQRLGAAETPKPAKIPQETRERGAEPERAEPDRLQPSRREGCKRRTRSCDEDVAQIGPKRIRKAAKREILLCDFEGCGKIFSNRQYLNHHKKYQHVHQKTFTCSEPSCGKSFNFKKHLKEHEKLHSDKRDYICEFCARSFRTSSNLIIHRRIHTGEKPLQCEICGFTCRQKASLNWHMKKHDADSFYQFSCNICGKKFEKRDNVTAHKSKSHPETPGGPPQAVPSEPPSLLGTGMG